MSYRIQVVIRRKRKIRIRKIRKNQFLRKRGKHGDPVKPNKPSGGGGGGSATEVDLAVVADQD